MLCRGVELPEDSLAALLRLNVPLQPAEALIF